MKSIEYKVEFFNTTPNQIWGRLTTTKTIKTSWWWQQPKFYKEEVFQKFVCNWDTNEKFYGEISGEFPVLVQEMLYKELVRARIHKVFDRF